MAKIIMPMARPASVSVVHVENEPTSGSADQRENEGQENRQVIRLLLRQGGAGV